MPNCRRPGCGWLVDYEWACCPNCGFVQGTTQPNPKSTCEHEFVVTGPHCVLCGGSFGDDDQPKWVGIAFTAGGLVATAAVGALIAFSHQAGLVKQGFYLLVPALGLFAYGLKLLIPDSR